MDNIGIQFKTFCQQDISEGFCVQASLVSPETLRYFMDRIIFARYTKSTFMMKVQQKVRELAQTSPYTIQVPK